MNPPPVLPTIDLLPALSNGDPEAWQIVVDRYQSLLGAVAARYRLSRPERADVVQLTWLRLLENANRIRCGEALGGWLATTASREALAMCRRNGREILTDEPEDVLQDAVDWPDPAGTLEAGERAAAVRRAVATLPVRERRLVEIFLEPVCPSYREISRRLDMPIGAIGPVRQRALARLRDALSVDPLLAQAA